MDQPGYYKTLARSVGIQADKLGEALHEVFQAPTDDKLRVLGILLTIARHSVVPYSAAETALEDFISFVAAEREWLARHGDESLS